MLALTALAGDTRADAPDLDLRWRGVALEDLPGEEPALVREAVRLANPGRFDEVLSMAWLERHVGHQSSERTTTDLEPAARHLVQIVGRAPRFSGPDDRGKPGLGVVIVEARLAGGDRSDWPELRVVRETPLSALALEISVSLSDRTTVVSDPDFGFARVYPSGVGALDDVRRPGYLSSLTPATELGRVSRASASLAAGGWNRGNPFIPFEIPYVSRRDGKERHWYVKTRVAFHIWQERAFSRGFNSYGCVTLRGQDLSELAAFVFATPTPLPLTVRTEAFADHRHPFPHEEGHYWVLENLGTAAHPLITRGMFYAIKKETGAPPQVSNMVDIFMTFERRHDPLGPVAVGPEAPPSLIP